MLMIIRSVVLTVDTDVKYELRLLLWFKKAGSVDGRLSGWSGREESKP